MSIVCWQLLYRYPTVSTCCGTVSNCGTFMGTSFWLYSPKIRRNRRILQFYWSKLEAKTISLYFVYYYFKRVLHQISLVSEISCGINGTKLQCATTVFRPTALCWHTRRNNDDTNGKLVCYPNCRVIASCTGSPCKNWGHRKPPEKRIPSSKFSITASQQFKL
jgi:hypothetical protein